MRKYIVLITYALVSIMAHGTDGILALDEFQSALPKDVGENPEVIQAFTELSKYIESLGNSEEYTEEQQKRLKELGGQLSNVLQKHLPQITEERYDPDTVEVLNYTDINGDSHVHSITRDEVKKMKQWNPETEKPPIELSDILKIASNSIEEEKKPKLEVFSIEIRKVGYNRFGNRWAYVVTFHRKEKTVFSGTVPTRVVVLQDGRILKEDKKIIQPVAGGDATR